jgi:hypothetical protein
MNVSHPTLQHSPSTDCPAMPSDSPRFVCPCPPFSSAVLSICCLHHSDPLKSCRFPGSATLAQTSLIALCGHNDLLSQFVLLAQASLPIYLTGYLPLTFQKTKKRISWKYKPGRTLVERAADEKPAFSVLLSALLLTRPANTELISDSGTSIPTWRDCTY